jgi:hypothetical protein
MELARTWIHNCHEQHVSCKGSRSEIVLPTRLLYVQPGLVRLVDSAALPSGNIRYIALSYCWGKETGIKPERDNMPDFRKGMDESKLNQTHRDAIEVCRRLHIEYIWCVSPGVSISHSLKIFSH